MIHQEAITTEWIQKTAKKLRSADPSLVEKAIWALRLLEGLVKQNIPFVFKGGTALMLHLDSAKRLSIDIDIILPERETEQGHIFDLVAKQQGFLRWELQKRKTDTSITKAHYKFFYTPVRKGAGKEDYVLLDVLHENVHYEKLVSLPVQSVFVPQTDAPKKVKVPTLDDLLADKLTAFAPNTTGIPYFRNENSMSMEIIKQLFDIGNLFDRAEDLNRIRTTFKKFAVVELSYRGQKGLTPKDVLDDIIQTSLCLVSRGKDGTGNYEELESGIKRVSGFIFSERYHLEKAITHASKAAWLASLIASEGKGISRYGEPSEMKDWEINEPMNTKLNKLKKSNPEAFYYWYQIYTLTTSH
ncbi:nucleotidyl transferase AbiEii/AbiGii toxin family protein [Balneolales bacterium ANBcel1]|nr:nucleotidyl transferase AbiEii/AbiGii toxin family protein [Balneolales bacterium ANBcel1]